MICEHIDYRILNCAPCNKQAAPMSTRFAEHLEEYAEDLGYFDEDEHKSYWVSVSGLLLFIAVLGGIFVSYMLWSK